MFNSVYGVIVFLPPYFKEKGNSGIQRTHWIDNENDKRRFDYT